MADIENLKDVSDNKDGSWPRKGLLFTTTGTTPVSGYSKAKRRLDALVAEANDGEALERHLPGSSPAQSFGGTSFWVQGREQLDARALAARAAQSGIIIEPGDTFFQQDRPPLNCFRLGFSAITGEQIAPGIERLSALIDELIQG